MTEKEPAASSASYSVPTHVPAGGATVVEFRTEVPGTYTIVDHSFGRMEKGAAAQIVVEGEANPGIFRVIQGGSGGSGGH